MFFKNIIIIIIRAYNRKIFKLYKFHLFQCSLSISKQKLNMQNYTPDILLTLYIPQEQVLSVQVQKLTMSLYMYRLCYSALFMQLEVGLKQVTCISTQTWKIMYLAKFMCKAEQTDNLVFNFQLMQSAWSTHTDA